MKFRRQVYTTKPTFLTQTLFKIMAVGLGFTGLCAQVQAQSYSYVQAEQQVLETRTPLRPIKPCKVLQNWMPKL